MQSTDPSTDVTTEMESKRYRKRALVAGVAGLAIAGGVFASAASLGGVNSTNLGSSSTVVASCDRDGVDVDYTTAYDAASNSYLVNAVQLDGVSAECEGQTVEVSLSGPNGTTTTSSPVVVRGGAVTIPVNDHAGEAVTKAAVVIGA